MMLKTQRRIAASILKAGKGRVWLDPKDRESISAAVTREDIKKLVSERAIQARQKKGISRYRAKKLRLQRAKGRRKGHGKRSGKKGARLPKKEKWISTIRPVRRKLVELRDSGRIDKATYRKLYSLAKGGVFKSKSHLEMYIKELR
ncbi:MAG: 50S ribosomal protein L19e [Candidatus Hydrothermarchaeota archaeon]|nr:50S ribosomal protein L19e [Candidatus Hydrothermarchaeota archaeon]